MEKDKIRADSAYFSVEKDRYTITIIGALEDSFYLGGKHVNVDFYGENLSVLPREARSALAVFLPYEL